MPTENYRKVLLKSVIIHLNSAMRAEGFVVGKLGKQLFEN